MHSPRETVEIKIKIPDVQPLVFGSFLMWLYSDEDRIGELPKLDALELFLLAEEWGEEEAKDWAYPGMLNSESDGILCTPDTCHQMWEKSRNSKVRYVFCDVF